VVLFDFEIFFSLRAEIKKKKKPVGENRKEDLEKKFNFGRLEERIRPQEGAEGGGEVAEELVFSFRHVVRVPGLGSLARLLETVRRDRLGCRRQRFLLPRG